MHKSDPCYDVARQTKALFGSRAVLIIFDGTPSGINCDVTADVLTLLHDAIDTAVDAGYKLGTSDAFQDNDARPTCCPYHRTGGDTAQGCGDDVGVLR